MRFVAALVAVASGLALIASWGGALHPLGDSLAVFRRELMIVFALSVVWTGWPRPMRWGLAGGALVWLGAFVWASRAGPADGGLILYQQNMLFSRDGVDAWVKSVRAASPDVLTLQEVGARTLAALKPLEADYPHRVHCPQEPLGEVVLSRLPMIEGFCSRRDGFAAMQVETADGPVWVVSLHLNWPWPHRQAAQVTQILPDMAPISGSVVLGGDFNAVAWSHTVARVSGAVRARRIGALMNTFDLPGGLPIGIDHVLSTGQGWTRRMPKHGSDHYGVLAGVRFDGG